MLKYQHAMQTECKFRREHESNDTTHITSRFSTALFGCTGEIRVLECELSTTKTKHFIKIKR